MAGVLLILMSAVVYGGASILSLLIGDPAYAQNELRQDLRRASARGRATRPVPGDLAIRG